MPDARGKIMRLPGLRHAGIVVTDMHEALRFYSGILGFQIWRQAVETGPYIDTVVGLSRVRLHWVKLKAPGGGLLELLQYLSHPRSAPRRTRACDIGASHIAVTVSDAAALVRTVRRKGLRVIADPAVSPDGKAKVAYIHDPDGTIVEVVEEIR